LSHQFDVVGALVGGGPEVVGGPEVGGGPEVVLEGGGAAEDVVGGFGLAVVEVVEVACVQALNTMARINKIPIDTQMTFFFTNHSFI
jgi:hypothetical protein